MEQFTLLAVLTMVLGVARVSRIVTYDDFPPTEWLRVRWIVLVGEKWGKLLTCFWCTTPYVAAGSLAWSVYSDFHWSWWAFWGTFAISQAASTLLSYDEPE